MVLWSGSGLEFPDVKMKLCAHTCILGLLQTFDDTGLIYKQ